MNNARLLVFREIKSRRWTAWDETRKNHLFHSASVVLKDCSFVVDADKKARVLLSNKRFPHAWVVGSSSPLPKSRRWREIEYNPFTMSHFSYKRSGRPVTKARFCILQKDGRVFVA